MAESTDQEIMQQFVDKIVPELQAVSKRFADSYESEVTPKGLEITASPYINTLIDGRKPTSSNAPKGNPTLQQILLQWIKDKSIIPRPDPSGQVPTLESLSWAMSKSMHMYGDLLYQSVQSGGSPNNIFDKIITPSRMENLLNLVGEKYFNEISSININDDN